MASSVPLYCCCCDSGLLALPDCDCNLLLTKRYGYVTIPAINFAIAPKMNTSNPPFLKKIKIKTN